MQSGSWAHAVRSCNCRSNCLPALTPAPAPAPRRCGRATTRSWAAASSWARPTPRTRRRAPSAVTTPWSRVRACARACGAPPPAGSRVGGGWRLAVEVAPTRRLSLPPRNNSTVPVFAPPPPSLLLAGRNIIHGSDGPEAAQKEVRGAAALDSGVRSGVGWSALHSEAGLVLTPWASISRSRARRT